MYSHEICSLLFGPFVEKGRGVYATKPLLKDSLICQYEGDLIKYAEARRRIAAYANDPNSGSFMYDFRFKNKRMCIDATEETLKLGRLVNHSRNGNLDTRCIPIHDVPHLFFFALRDIKVGEELLYDYGDYSPQALKAYSWLKK